MYFPILIEIKNMDASIAEKLGICLWNMLILNLNLKGEGHPFANWLFYILIFSRKCLVFQFLTCGVRMFLAILTGAENGYFISWKIVDIPQKSVDFES